MFKVQSSTCGNARFWFQAADVKRGFEHEESRRTVLSTQVNRGHDDIMRLYLESLKGGLHLRMSPMLCR